MRSSLLIFIGLCLSITLFAQSKDSTDAVIMLDFEQAWNDDTGRLSVKNNSKEAITDFAFKITYIDMEGQILGSEKFTKYLYLSPGEVKTINIPAFKTNENYSYYKSEAMPGLANTFTTRFNLIEYNQYNRQVAAQNHQQSTDTTSNLSSSTKSTHHRKDLISDLGVITILLGILFASYIIVILMTMKLNRQLAPWIVLSLVLTPMFVILILLFMGKSKSPYEDINNY